MEEVVTDGTYYALLVHGWFITRFTLHVTLFILILKGFVPRLCTMLTNTPFTTFKCNIFNLLFLNYFIFTIKACNVLSHGVCHSAEIHSNLKYFS